MLGGWVGRWGQVLGGWVVGCRLGVGLVVRRATFTWFLVFVAWFFCVLFFCFLFSVFRFPFFVFSFQQALQTKNYELKTKTKNIARPESGNRTFDFLNIWESFGDLSKSSKNKKYCSRSSLGSFFIVFIH